MTSEEFRAQYQVGERLTTPPVVTHRAIDESGLPVLVHYILGSETQSASALLERVEAARAAGGSEIRDVADVDGVAVVVTKVLTGFSTLPDWLEARGSTGSPPADPESGEPGVYTQFFKVSDLADGTEAAAPTSVPKPSQPSAPVEAAARAASPTVPEEEKTSPTMPEEEKTSPTVPEEEKAPGAYTMIFGKATGEAEDSSPKPEGEPGPAGVSPPAPPPQPEAPPAKEVATPEGEEKAPGAYTMLFGAGEQAGPSPPPPPSSPPQTPTATPPPRSSPLSREAPGGEPPKPSQPEEAPGRKPPSLSPPEAEPSPPSKPVFPRIDAQPGRPPPPPPPSGSPGAIAPATEGAPPQPPTPPSEPPVPEEARGPEKKSDAPGAYTQIFGRAGADAPHTGDRAQSWSPPPAPGHPKTPPQPSPGHGPSSPEWQRWKDTPGASGRHIPSDDYLSRLSRGPDLGQTPSAPPPPPSGEVEPGPLTSGPLPGGGGRPPEGPGHYTMVREGFSAGPVPPSPTRPPATPEPAPGTSGGAAPAPGGRSKLLPVLGLVGILLVIIALIVVLAVMS